MHVCLSYLIWIPTGAPCSVWVPGQACLSFLQPHRQGLPFLSHLLTKSGSAKALAQPGLSTAPVLDAYLVQLLTQGCAPRAGGLQLMLQVALFLQLALQDEDVTAQLLRLT